MELTATQQLLIDIVIPVAVLVFMFSMGIGLRLGDFKRVLTEPRSFLVAMGGQYLLMPSLAVLLIWLLNIPREIAVGAIIVAAIPGGLFSNGLVYVGRGNSALSVSLTGVSQIIGMISIPLWITWALSFYYGDVEEIDFPVARSLALIFVINIVPMALGMLVLQYAPNLAGKLEPILRRVSLVLLFAIIVIAMLPNFEVALEQAGTAGILAIAVCGGGVLFGNLATRAVGLPWREAFTNGIEIGIQNLATAILIAVTILGRNEFAVYTAVYSVVSPCVALISLAIYNRYLRRPD